MKKYNLIVVINQDITKVLMCQRKKHSYIGMYNLIGGKKENDNGLKEAYRELLEETSITKKDIDLRHIMNIEYLFLDKYLEVYYGILKNDVKVIPEVNELKWVDMNDNFFDVNKYAGEGNIGHIIEEVRKVINNDK